MLKLKSAHPHSTVFRNRIFKKVSGGEPPDSPFVWGVFQDPPEVCPPQF